MKSLQRIVRQEIPFLACLPRRIRINPASAGEVAEWSNAAVLKTVERESVPGVRIPVSPPQASQAGPCRKDVGSGGLVLALANTSICWWSRLKPLRKSALVFFVLSMRHLGALLNHKRLLRSRLSKTQFAQTVGLPVCQDIDFPFGLFA